MKLCISSDRSLWACVPQCCVDSARYLMGIELFNRAEFFDAHEVLEDVWRAAPEGEKKFLQGIIQVAVALYHHANGNSVGARSVLRRAFRNLSRYPEGFAGVQLGALLHSISNWQRAIDEGSPVPPFPKIIVGK
jgi:predicted metal-dependent hydrolase